MVSTFGDRMTVLSDAVGHGKIEAHVVIDQVYSHFQHESLDLDHPRGGNAEFLRRPLLTEQGRYMQHAADKLITTDGSDIIQGMIDVAEDLVTDSAEQTPREFDDLMRSGHPFVIDEGATVYDRAPEVGRLSEAELREKNRTRAGLGLSRGHTQHIPHDIKAALRAKREQRRQGLL